MNYVIKVADFGLSVTLEAKDYFRQDSSDAIKLPIKWLAIESLNDYIFSEKTDVVIAFSTCPTIQCSFVCEYIYLTVLYTAWTFSSYVVVFWSNLLGSI